MQFGDAGLVFYTSKSKCARPIFARSHQQQLSVLIQAIRLREVPNRALRLIIASSSHHGGAGMLVQKFVSPLPDIADQVLHAERTRPLWMSIHGIRISEFSSLVGCGHDGSIPRISPRVESPVATLSGILPLPLMRQPL